MSSLLCVNGKKILKGSDMVDGSQRAWICYRRDINYNRFADRRIWPLFVRGLRILAII